MEYSAEYFKRKFAGDNSKNILMILQSEIKHIAEREGVPPDTVDKSRVMGHLLSELFRLDWAQENLLFKGGTCLKKCYFKDHRFSEDLDFTLTNPDFAITDRLVRTLCYNIPEKASILLYPSKIEQVISDNQMRGYKTHILFFGANHKSNQQPIPSQRWLTSVKVVDEPDYRLLTDEFSDSHHFSEIMIPCCSISEIIAEKFRSLLQRSYAAPRDYYDLWYILRSAKIDWMKTLDIFREKLIFKKIHFFGHEDFFEEGRLKHVKREWKNSLQSHIRYLELPDVEIVLSELKAICENAWS
jgi:predicted nucleotidyltransferase component of viral defense system